MEFRRGDNETNSCSKFEIIVSLRPIFLFFFFFHHLDPIGKVVGQLNADFDSLRLVKKTCSLRKREGRTGTN